MRLATVAVFCIALSVTGAVAADSMESAYVARCDGSLDIVTSATGALVRRVDLTGRLQIKRSPGVAGATFDNCLLNGALYAPRQHVFYSLAPDHSSEPQRYHLWRFTVPDLTARELSSSIVSSGAAPTLALEPDGTAKIETQSEQPTTINLSGYAGADGVTGNTVLARSSSRVLMRLFASGENGLTISIADTNRHTLTRLRALPPTTDRLVHLAPGGDVVLVEIATGGGEAARRTGGLVLFNAQTGLQMRRLTDTRIVSAAFVGITPAGYTLYRKGSVYFSVDLDRHFSTVSLMTALGPTDYFVP